MTLKTQLMKKTIQILNFSSQIISIIIVYNSDFRIKKNYFKKK